MESPEQKLKIYKIGDEASKRGKEYTVRQEEKDFGGNVFNTVRKATVSGEDKGYSKSFVLRRPRLNFEKNAIESENDIKQRLSIIASDISRYQGLKAAGLRHLPTTYQLGGVDEGDPVIVMTDYTEGDTKIVLSNNTVGNGIILKDVENTDELLQEMGEDIKAASTAGFSIPLDAYFFVVPVEGGVVKKMEFAIADLDRCIKAKEGSKLKEHLLAKNIDEARGALTLVLINHLQNPDVSDVLSAKAKNWADRLKAEQAEVAS